MGRDRRAMLVYHFEGVPRNPFTVAVKNVLTLGIYTKVWLYRVNREMDGREGFHIHLGWLALMLWLPIVTPAIVKFQTAGRLNQMVSDPVTIPLIRARRLGWISLVPVIGAGFYAYWVQQSLNMFWFWHRRKERFHLNKERIKELAKQGETEKNLQKRFALEEECRRIEREMEEEIQAVRIKWGEERFQERKKRADMHAQRGRLTRKQVHDLRRREQEERKKRRLQRRRERSLVARYKPRRADPEKEELWEPYTPLPRRTSQEILEAARAEGRDPDKDEQREAKRADRLVAARAAETKRLEKRRAKLLARLRSKEAKAEARATRKKRGPRKKGRGTRRTDEEQGEPSRRRLLVLPAPRDPEEDAHWEPRTPPPERTPQEIEAVAQAESREPTKKEQKQIKQAEARITKREKEQTRLADAREKAREKARRKTLAEQAKLEKRKDDSKAKRKPKSKRKSQAKSQAKGKPKSDKAEKKRLQQEKKAQKGEKAGKDKSTKEDRLPKKLAAKPKKGKKSKKPAEPAKKPTGKPAGKGDTAAGPLVLRVRCPRCQTEVPVQKPAEGPARLKCPSCGLVGKI